MSHYKLTGKTVLSFSGGRSSAYMLAHVLSANKGTSDLIVCFANTGKEHEETLKFVHECGKRWSVEIVWLEYRDNDAGFQIVTFDTASRNGEPFAALIKKRKYLPNPVTRFCTVELKIRVIHKYLRSIGLGTEENPVSMMTGIRADEQRRVSKIRARGTTSESRHAEMVLPLADANVGVDDITSFWSAQDFDLGLPTINGKTMLGNCDLCFLKGAKQVFSIIASDKGVADWWIEQESAVQSSNGTIGNGGRFRFDRPSYQQMKDYAGKQGDLFIGDDTSLECFCGD